MSHIENKNIGAITQEELDKILNKPSSSDVVAGILISAKEISPKEKIPSDTKSLHDFINEKKKEEKFKEILGGFVFSQTDIYPFSRSLEETVTMLQLGGLLVLDNPRFGTFSISTEANKRAEDRLNKVFSLEERNLLKELGEKYGEFLRENGKVLV